MINHDTFLVIALNMLYGMFGFLPSLKSLFNAYLLYMLSH